MESGQPTRGALPQTPLINFRLQIADCGLPQLRLFNLQSAIRNLKLSEYVVNHSTGHISQTHFAAAELVREAGVIQAQQVENGGVQIVYVDFVLDGEVSVLVG